MVKILLTSDLHIGSADLPIRHADRMTTLKRIVSLAIEYDILMIAGDLFDSPEPAEEIVDEVVQYFTVLRKKGTAIIFSPGRRECADGKAPAFAASIPADRIFSGDGIQEPYAFERNGQSVYIYGLPACAHTEITSLGKESAQGFHIGLFHTEFDMEDNEENNPDAGIRKRDIRNLKLDFYALGHNHAFKLYKYSDRIIGAYPGSPEPVRAGETGDRYVVALSIEGDELTQIKRLTINTVTAVEKEFLFSPESESQLRSVIESCASDKTLLRLTLSGMRGIRTGSDIIDQYRKNFYHIILDDRTVAPLDAIIAEFSSEDSLRGEFFAILRDNMKNGTFPDDIDTCALSRILSGIVSMNTVSEETLCALFKA